MNIEWSWLRAGAPLVTTDKEYNREWVHDTPPRYYLYQDEDDKTWCVIDRSCDISVSGRQFVSKDRCIKSFYKNYGKGYKP